MERWWNDEMEKLNYWQKDLSMTIPTLSVLELHLPFTLIERRLTSQTRNVKILFSCYITRKASHIIDKIYLIIIRNCMIVLKEVLLK